MYRIFRVPILFSLFYTFPDQVCILQVEGSYSKKNKQYQKEKNMKHVVTVFLLIDDHTWTLNQSSR